MKYEQVRVAFGGAARVAEALDLSIQAIVNWRIRKRIPPLWQIRLAALKPQLKPDANARRFAARLGLPSS